MLKLNHSKLSYSNSKKLKFISYYIFKLFKKFLSLKLTIFFNKCNYKNIINLKKKINIFNLKPKIFYNRKEIVPLRILRYNLYFNITQLKELNVGFLLNNKLSVYNGKKAKPINIFKV